MRPKNAFRLVLSSLAGWVALTACGLGPDERSGGDSGRGDAKAAALETLLYDRVSVDDGDSTDWKSFKLEDPAKVTVKIWWDDPKAVSATIELRDMDAKPVAKLKHSKSATPENLGPIKLGAGTYFMRIQAGAGASVYSFEISTGSDDEGGGVPDL